MARFKAKINFWSTTEYAKVPVYANMTSILFRNSGDTDAFINGVYKIAAGEESPGINTGSPDTTFEDADLYVSFANPAGVAPLVQAIIIETFDKVSDFKNGTSEKCERF